MNRREVLVRVAVLAALAISAVALAAGWELTAGNRDSWFRPPGSRFLAPGSGFQATTPRRIVSIVPAATEMLFAIGAGPRVVAVSSFDRYPDAVGRLPRVGALLDPDVERILAMRPELVVTYQTQPELREQFQRAHIATFSYVHGNIADALRMIRTLGERLGLADSADRVARDIEEQLEGVRRRVRPYDRPSALLAFGRDSTSLSNVYASGGIGFLHDMLEIAGATNVFAGVKRESLQVSTEQLLARAPQLIVELRYGRALAAQDIQETRESWRAVSAVPAVRNNRVVVLVGDEFVVAGPRIGAATEKLARAIHPEAFR